MSMFLRLLPLVSLLLPLCLNAAGKEEVLHLMPAGTVQHKANIEIMDARLYRGEIGKFRTYDRNRWSAVQFNRPFGEVMHYLNDSLAASLNMTQAILVRIRSFYLQEIRYKGSSMQYGRLHYLAQYYRVNRDSTFSLVYTADTSHPMQTYLLPVTAVNEIRLLLQACLIRFKSGLPQGAALRREELREEILPEAESEDLPGFGGEDGIFPTYEDLYKNRLQRSGERITKIGGIGELTLQNPQTKKKSTLSMFSLFAYMRQGILYKCTRFGSFPLLRLNGRFLYAGFDERFARPRPDAPPVRRVSKRGGLTLTPNDLEHQKYLFALDSKTGKPYVLCSLTPQDDYSAILMRLSQD
jgi:hypothetical protein